MESERRDDFSIHATAESEASLQGEAILTIHELLHAVRAHIKTRSDPETIGAMAPMINATLDVLRELR